MSDQAVKFTFNIHNNRNDDNKDNDEVNFKVSILITINTILLFIISFFERM